MRLLIACALCATDAAAQAGADPNEESRNEAAIFADFGFAGAMPAGAWGPIDIIVQSADTPLSGYVELSHEAGGELVTHVAPFAAAANTTARVPVAVHLPWWTERISVAAHDERTGRVASIDYESIPTQRTARLPSLYQSPAFVISTTPRIQPSRVCDAIGATEGNQKNPFTPIAITPERLPTSRLAYDAASILIIDPLRMQRADPRSIDAIARWTASGGRLCIIADGPGTDWRAWVAGAPAAADIRLSPAQPLTVEGVSLIGRSVKLGPLATGSGWSTALEDKAGNPVAAEGPFGLGWVTILGVDPMPIAELNPEQRGDILTRVFAEQPALDPLTIDTQPAWMNNTNYWAARQGDWKLYQTLDAIAISDPPGAGSFVLIAAVPLALALLLGPVDFLGLGLFRKRHLAWLSALLWIGAVGAIATIAPRHMRAGSSELGTIRVTDAMLPNLAMQRGAGINAAAELPADIASWQAGVALLFSASEQPFRLSHTEPSAWRPIDSGESGMTPFAGVVFRQSPAGPGLAAGAAIAPISIPSRIWSLTALHEQGPASPGFAVAVSRRGESHTVTLTGAPDTMTIRSAQLTISGHRSVPDAFAGTARQLTFTHPETTSNQGLSRGNEELVAAAAALLDGPPAGRLRAIDALSRAGWARLDLFVESPPNQPQFEANGEPVQARYCLYRILVPMPNTDADPAPESTP